MDKKNQHRRSRRQNKITEDNFWDCSVCTYRNTAEAFKCLMCDVRKGTSTRKPRINPQLVAQQVAQQYTQSLPKVKKESAPGSVASSSTPTTTPTPVSTPTLPISTPAVFTASSSNSMSPVTVTTAAAPATITTPATSTVTSTITTTNNNNNTSSSTPAVSSKVEPSPPPPPSVIAAPVIPPAVAATAAAAAVAVATPGNKPEKIRAPSVDGKSTSSRRLRPKLKNVDRSRSECQAVTVNNVTVIITEFQPKRHYSSLSDRAGHQPSSGPTAPGFNHSNGGGVGGGGGNAGDLGTFQMEGSPAENGLHPDLSHKHQRLAL